MYLGFGEGLWLAGYQNAYASKHAREERWGPQLASTAVWLSDTAGGLAGALIEAVNRPTPGRVSFTASTAIWSGTLAAFAAHALQPNDSERAQSTYLVGALAYNAGLLAGIVAGPVIAPSVKRVRYTDLGALAGALLVGGGYALLVDDADSRAGLGLAAVGGAVGLGVAVWATQDMAERADYAQGSERRTLARLWLSAGPTSWPVRLVIKGSWLHRAGVLGGTQAQRAELTAAAGLAAVF